MNLLFCGTPDFAVTTLNRLLAENFAIGLVLTNQDEPSGRGYEVRAPPVKQAALQAGLPVYQPPKLADRSTVEFLSRYRPDAIVVVAYGHILPKWLIELPRLGCINLHASLLPKYRGAAPIQWSLIRGESVTGVTTMQIDLGLDTGDILLKREVVIQDDDTAETLSIKLGRVGADLMIETLRDLESGMLKAQTQDHAKATLAPMLKKQDGRIDWSLPAMNIWNRIRGLCPWPGAFTTFRGRTLHLWSAPRPTDRETLSFVPGTLISTQGKLSVVCGDGTVLDPCEVQLEGRKRLAVRDFLNGVNLSAGEVLGA